jgi:hypothetical protein
LIDCKNWLISITSSHNSFKLGSLESSKLICCV